MTKDFVYLASASPRRRELLAQIGVGCRVMPADIDESRRLDEAVDAYVLRLARTKAETVWQRLTDPAGGVPVLAADTIVVLDGAALGKPTGPDEAQRMLESLSGRSHTVLTAVALCGHGADYAQLAASEVRFRPTTAEERAAYCRTGEPLDKAGGYGIQGYAAVFIEAISGSYSTVMGLPLFETAELLKQFGMPAWLNTAGQDS